jgi:methylmalonyl-CoA mutase C-terminal domain/subunit
MSPGIVPGGTTPGRVLVAKLGLDGHDVGAKVVCHILRDAGFEVIYTGIRRTPEAVASVAIDEDVDVVAVSLLSGAHLPLVTRLLALLGEDGDVIPVVLGGAIPDADRPALIDLGVAEIAGGHASSSDIVEIVRRQVRRRRDPLSSETESWVA